MARLTPEGQVFYEEAIKTLAQAERSIATAQRAAKGEIGRLGIGYIGFATSPFLPDLLRKYKTRRPGVALRLEENVPSGQDLAFDRVRIDFVATWRKREPSIALKLFLELLDEELPAIRQKTRYT